MAISIKDLRKVTADQPPRILIHALPGLGKTTLASEFPSPVFLQTEEGTPAGITLASFGVLSTFGDLMDAVASLYTDEHDHKTVVLDSLSETQRLVWNETCARGDDKGNAKKQIEDFGYGKGYVYALRVWQELIDGLNALRRDRGMSIVLIAHSRIDRFDDPDTTSYDRYEIDLHDKAVGAFERDMDAIILLKKDVVIKTEDQGFNKERALATGGQSTWIYTMPRPAFIAKNRLNMPEKLLFKRGEGYAALAPYLPAQPEHEPPAETKKPAPVKTTRKAA